MATATSSSVHSGARESAFVSFARAEAAVREALAQRPVALLALRIADLERIAWREGRARARSVEARAVAAFRSASARVLRGGDLPAHDAGSDIFAVVLLGSRAPHRSPLPVDCRSALERIAASMRAACELHVESGWTLIVRDEAAPDFATELERALQRGARERERYAFFAAVGHELRTPLTSIRGYLETVLADAALDAPTQRRFLETAQREALRMGRLVEGMLDFSMLDLSTEAIPAACDLLEQVAVACDAVLPSARRHGVRIVRGRNVSVRVGLSADACVQSLINLLDNAVKHGRAGGCVRITSRLCTPYACVRVDDDGGGVGDDTHAAIFQAGVRCGAREPGRGMGLAIVKTLVERAGGEVRVARSPLGGARFELYLPVRAQAAAKAEIPASSS